MKLQNNLEIFKIRLTFNGHLNIESGLVVNANRIFVELQTFLRSNV